MSLARLWTASGRSDRSLEFLTSIYSRFSEGFQTLDLVSAADSSMSFDRGPAVTVHHDPEGEGLAGVTGPRRAVDGALRAYPLRGLPAAQRFCFLLQATR